MRLLLQGSSRLCPVAPLLFARQTALGPALAHVASQQQAGARTQGSSFSVCTVAVLLGVMW